jgi:putative phosphoesterase
VVGYCYVNCGIRLALLSDIHGNRDALEAVVDAFDGIEIDFVVVAGDSVGYYFWPKEVIRLLRDIGAQIIAGNHEHMLIRSLTDSNYLHKITKKYGSGIVRALESFDADEIEFIRSLPDCLTIDAENHKVCVFHGSPRNTDEYIYPDTDLSQLHASVPLGARWIILGHTHYPMDRESNGVRFINPGSVGQSRNGVSKAFWAILDTEADVVEMKSTEYNRTNVIDEASRLHADIPYLSRILESK